MPKGAKKRKQAAVQKKLDQEILNTPSNSPPAGRNEKQSDSSSSSSDSDKDLKRDVDQNEEVLNGCSDIGHDVKDEKERGDVIVEVARIEVLESGEGAIHSEVKEIGVEEFSAESAADSVAETVGESVEKFEEVVSVVEQAQVIELPQSRGIGGMVENIAEMEVPPKGHDGGGQAAGYITDRNVAIPAGSLEHRAEWWNCCGLFEVFMAPKDNARSCWSDSGIFRTTYIDSLP